MKKSELRELYQMMFPEYPDVVTVKELREMLGIEYRTKRTGKSRLIKFLRRDSDDANDAGIAI